jgi:NAD(P)-dependent dehydrogenase (short-subunit alcohol dehydrogenase family)
MRIAVFGSTRGIGRQVVVQALHAGHEVTAIARRPEAVTTEHERLQVVRADALEPSTLRQALKEQDAVVSALGIMTRDVTVFCAPLDRMDRTPPGHAGLPGVSESAQHPKRKQVRLLVNDAASAATGLCGPSLK